MGSANTSLILRGLCALALLAPVSWVSAGYVIKVPSKAAQAPAPAAQLVLDAGARRWSDGSYAASCLAYRQGDARHLYQGATGDGIYAINTGSAVANVYCDMTTDGGGWTLIAYWVGGASRDFKIGEVAISGSPLSTYTQNAALYPVPPSGALSVFSEQLLKSTRSGWVARYGNWIKWNALALSNLPIGSSGWPAVSELGPKTIFIGDAGWFEPTTTNGNFGLWTDWGNSGPCGGAFNRGYDNICPALRTYYPLHIDLTGQKFLFVR